MGEEIPAEQSNKFYLGGLPDSHNMNFTLSQKDLMKITNNRKMKMKQEGNYYSARQNDIIQNNIDKLKQLIKVSPVSQSH